MKSRTAVNHKISLLVSTFKTAQFHLQDTQYYDKIWNLVH